MADPGVSCHTPRIDEDVGWPEDRILDRKPPGWDYSKSVICVWHCVKIGAHVSIRILLVLSVLSAGVAAIAISDGDEWRIRIGRLRILVDMSLVRGFTATYGLDFPDSFGLVDPNVTAEPRLATIQARGIGGSVWNTLN